MDPLLILFVLLALVAGGALGWYLGSKKGRDGEVDFKRMAKELGDAQIELATLRANEASFDKQIAAMNQAREELLAQFKATGGEVLARAQEEFLKRAEEKFGHAERASEQKLKALLDPVGEKLKNYEEQVRDLEEKRVDAFGSLRAQIDEMRKGQDRVSSEAARLVNSLRNAPKARGRWGEQQLRNVLESCGLAEHTDFITERSVDTEDGRLRPDAIVIVPGGRSLVIDAKVSLNDYQDAFDAGDDEARTVSLTRHFTSMKNHIEGLSRKAYWDQFEETPDYVIMFVPGEHFLTAALEHDPKLWDFAFDKRVLLATPTNLIAIARTVAAVWRQEKMAEEAQEIGRLGKEMYDRIALVAEKLGRTGAHLDRAVRSYNDSMNSFNSRLVVTGRKFAERSVETGKRDLEDVALIESAPSHGATASDGKPFLLGADEETAEAAE